MKKKFRILVATDYSESVWKAEQYAIQFAKWCVYYTYHESFDCWIKNDNLKAERFTSNELICKFKKEKDCE